MKPYINRTLGLKVNVMVPSTVEEYDTLAGSPGVCLTSAIANGIYKQWNHEFRDALCETLVKQTGVEMLSRKEKSKDGSEKLVKTETEQSYVDRLLADGKITDGELQKLADAVAAEIKFDPSPSTRQRKAPKEIQNNAAAIMAAVTAGQSSAKVVAKKLGDELGVKFADAFGEFNEESVIAALMAIKAKEDRDRISRFV